MKRILLLVPVILIMSVASGQNVPQNVVYSQVQEFVEELVNEGVVDLNTGIRPYTRQTIADKLMEAKRKDVKLNSRQRKELDFYLRDYVLETEDTLGGNRLSKSDGVTYEASLWQPAAVYRDNGVKVRLTPLLGAMSRTNENGTVIDRWWGADLSMQVGEHISMYANARDNAYWGELLKAPLKADKVNNARLAKGPYYNLKEGVVYKEADYGGDYLEMRGGVLLHGKYGSVGIIKDNVAWGESRHSSNILSGRTPSFPMVTLNFKPVKWIELNYIHGWLVSDTPDSSSVYYALNKGVIEKEVRPANKYIAADMLTITPIKHLNISVGNSIIYGESSPHLAYFMPLAYYKGLDHAQSKGVGLDNQNSQLFAMVSSRNIPHVQLYASVFVDEFKFARLKPSNNETNPMSWQFGTRFTVPAVNAYGNVEMTRTNILTYKHNVMNLPYSSNGYYLGHYLGDNSQEFYAMVGWRPIPRLDIKFSYTNAEHFRDYDYDRSKVEATIAENPYEQLTWRNEALAMRVTYELVNNCYLKAGVELNNTRGYDGTLRATNYATTAENGLSAQGYLDQYTPKFYQGKNVTFELGASFGF